MATKITELLQSAGTEPGPFLKLLNFVAAVTGGLSLLNIVNIGVGIASGIWLTSQIWAHYRYGLPYKRAQLELIQRKLSDRSYQEDSANLDSEKGGL